MYFKYTLTYKYFNLPSLIQMYWYTLRVVYHLIFTLLNCLYLDNEVDWDICHELTDSDWHIMFPGKVGVVRKIKMLITPQVSMFQLITSQACSNMPAGYYFFVAFITCIRRSSQSSECLYRHYA